MVFDAHQVALKERTIRDQKQDHEDQDHEDHVARPIGMHISSYERSKDTE